MYSFEEERKRYLNHIGYPSSPQELTKAPVIPPTPIEVPETAYPLPKLPVEEASIEPQRWVAGKIEDEGSFFVRIKHLDMIAPKVYRYEYRAPVFAMSTIDEKIMTLMGEYLALTVRPYPRLRPWRWEIHAEGSKAIAIARWSLPFLIPDTKRYRDDLRILEEFSKRPMRRLRIV